MIRSEKTADIALVVTAVIWGSGFIATEYAIQTGAGTSLIIAMRFLIAGFILGILYSRTLRNMTKETLKVGVIAGGILFLGFYLQTLGQSLTTVSNSSFLTSTNVVIVPFIVWFFTKESPKMKYYVLGLTSLAGIGILTINFQEGLSFQVGDLIVLASAICFALHIAYLGVYGKGQDNKHLTFLQMAVAGLCALVFLLVFDSGSIHADVIVKALPSTTYLAIFSSCICYYIQTTAQQYTKPSKAGIILCMEGFFGSVFAVLLGIDELTAALIIGGTIILTSVIMSEIDMKKWKTKKEVITEI